MFFTGLFVSSLTSFQSQPSAPSTAFIEFYPASYYYSKNYGEISQKGASDVTASYVRKGINTNMRDLSVHLHPQSWAPWFVSFGANNYGGMGVYVLEGGRIFEQWSVGARLGIAAEFEDDSIEKKQSANATYHFSSSQTRNDNYVYGVRVSREIVWPEYQIIFNPRVMYTRFSTETDEPNSNSDRDSKTKRDYFLIGSDAWLPINSLLDVGTALDFTYGTTERTVTDKSGSSEHSFKSKTTFKMAQVQIFQVRVKL